MRRRPLLAGLAVVSTGCLGRPAANDQNNTKDSKTKDNQILTNTSPPIEEVKKDCRDSEGKTPSYGNEARTPEITVGIDDPANDIFLDVDVVQEFTNDHPAKIIIIIGNNSEEKRTFLYGPRPLSHGQHVNIDAELMANWRETDTHTPDDSGCWRANTELIGEMILMEQEITPGETIEEEYILLTPEDSAECMPVGIYEFSATIEVGSSSEDASAVNLNWVLCLQ